ncbi:MAG: hypothetical protein RLZZ241_2570 [Bacteroidota bacterium]|jgi:cation transport ATPase
MVRLVVVLFIGILSFSAQAQDKNKRISFEVLGNCPMCEERIEKASLQVSGVKYASWSAAEQSLTLIINTRKCTPDKVKIAIAAVGHDTDSFKASDSIYKTLPACCKYRDPGSTHLDHH